MDLSKLNWLAIVVAALAGFALGGVWYGPLFGRAWMAETGMTEEKARSANMAKIYGTVFVLNLVAATSLAMFVGPQSDWRFGLFAGFMTGLTFVAVAFGITYLFEQRSLKLWLINSGYQTLFFSVKPLCAGSVRIAVSPASMRTRLRIATLSAWTSMPIPGTPVAVGTWKIAYWVAAGAERRLQSLTFGALPLILTDLSTISWPP